MNTPDHRLYRQSNVDPVKRTNDPPRQSNRSIAIIAFLVCFSIGSISLSRGVLSEYNDVFKSLKMDHSTSLAVGDQMDTGGMAGDDDVGSFPQSDVEFEHEEENDNESTRDLNIDETGDNESDNDNGVAEDNKGEEEKGRLDAVEGEKDEQTLPTGNDENTKRESNDEHGDDAKSSDGSTADEDRQRMNVLVLYPDDWRWNTIGKENSIVKTPFLDSLADDGIHFRQNAVTTSICWMSRATLFSGQWASRHQSYKLKCPHFAKGRRWRQTWPVLMKNDGYFVGHVGKWQYHSDNVGRFEWESYHEGKHVYHKYKRVVHAEDLAREDAIKFLRERPKEKPFALTVAFYPPKPVTDSTEPGRQWTPKKETRAIYENMTIPEPYNMTHAFKLLPLFLQRDRSAGAARWRYRYKTPLHYQEAMKNIYSLITQVDDACKQIVDEVKAQGLYNNTMIIFSTDNGMFHGSHGLAGKWYPYQESIRVPLIIHDPRMSSDKVGTVDENFTLNVDLASTILGAAGLKPHERMQGRDISDLYLENRSKENGKTALENEPWREEFYYEFDFFDEMFIPSSKALVRKKWKYIYWPHKKLEQLFNLEDDPMEFTSVFEDPKNDAIANEMRSRMYELKAEIEEPEDQRLNCWGGNWTVNPPDEME